MEANQLLEITKQPNGRAVISNEQLVKKLDDLLERFGKPCFPVKEISYNHKPIGSPQALFEVFVVQYLRAGVGWTEIKTRFQEWLLNQDAQEEYKKLVKVFLAEVDC